VYYGLVRGGEPDVPAFLAPDIVVAILKGRQPVGPTADVQRKAQSFL
jgi:hypothetical protein